MKYSTVTVLAVSIVASGSVLAGTRSPKPSSAQSRVASAPLPEVLVQANRVTEAVEGYVNAMSTHDVNSLSKVFTEDAMVEFVTDASEARLAVHADSLLDDAAPAGEGPRSRVANVRVFPTKDANVVFVQYDIVSDAANHTGDTAGRLAMIEMRGERIERMTNFNGTDAALANSSACVGPRGVAVTRR
jgi:hypothetical protein